MSEPLKSIEEILAKFHMWFTSKACWGAIKIAMRKELTDWQEEIRENQREECAAIFTSIFRDAYETDKEYHRNTYEAILSAGKEEKTDE